MQKPGCYQAPPLAGQNVRPELRSEIEKGLAVQVHEGLLVSRAHARDHGDEIQSDIDQQDDGGGEMRMRDQPAQDGGGGAAIYRPRPQFGIAVWADAILSSDERPALRAHPAGFHLVHFTTRSRADLQMTFCYNRRS